MTRREFILNLFNYSLLAAAGLGGYSFAIEPNWIRQVNYDFPTLKWPSGHAPLKIAIAADLHVGCPSINLKRLRGVVSRLNALKPDVTLLLGDFLIGGVALGKYVRPEPIGEALSFLKARYGVYSVLGNHDWWKDGQGMWNALDHAGIKVLENDAILVKRPDQKGQNFWIAGLADDTTRTPDIPATLSKITDDQPVVMISHDPAPFMDMPTRPVVTLAGHTHGGQVAMPFFGPLIIPGRAPRKYAYGHIIEEGRELIVSSGVGTSILPVRFNMLPEILSLTIRFLAA